MNFESSSAVAKDQEHNFEEESEDGFLEVEISVGPATYIKAIFKDAWVEYMSM